MHRNARRLLRRRLTRWRSARQKRLKSYCARGMRSARTRPISEKTVTAERKVAKAAEKAVSRGVRAAPTIPKVQAGGKRWLGKHPIPLKGAAFRARNFDELCKTEECTGYASEGSWTSRAYKTVVYHTGDITLAREAYTSALKVWHSCSDAPKRTKDDTDEPRAKKYAKKETITALLAPKTESTKKKATLVVKKNVPRGGKLQHALGVHGVVHADCTRYEFCLLALWVRVFHVCASYTHARGVYKSCVQK